MCGPILSQHTSWRWKGGVSVDTYLLEMKKLCFNWHISLNCEQVKFGLTHNSWLWTCFFHPFFVHLFSFFIHLTFFWSILVFHPQLLFIHVQVVKYSSMSQNIMCHVSTKYAKKCSILFTCSCSCSHTHQIAIPFDIATPHLLDIIAPCLLNTIALLVAPCSMLLLLLQH